MRRAREFTHLGDRVSAGGGCEAAVTARTRCGCAKHRECNELLYGRFPLKLKGAVYRCYVILIVKTKSVLCVWCGKLIHDTCARVNWVSPRSSRNFTCKKYEGNWRGGGAGGKVM